jgi:short-subunit dehydrogenase
MSVRQGFTDQVVIVTGASQGIGKAFCREIAPQRPKLVLAARDRAALEAVASECASLGAEALVVSTDVSNEGDCRKLIEDTVARFGRLDVLLLNAGLDMWARFDELTDASIFERLMRVNYLGSVYPTFHALAHLKRSRGRIGVVASVAGLTGVPTRTGYAASKHALFGFFESLRIELHGSGVSVTLLAPDFVVSEIHRRAIGPDGQPLGTSPMDESKIMTAEECARRMARALGRRQRLWLGSLRAKAGRWVRVAAPRVIDGIARRAVAAHSKPH